MTSRSADYGGTFSRTFERDLDWYLHKKEDNVPSENKNQIPPILNSSRVRLVPPLGERNYRDDPCRPALVVGEVGVQGSLTLEDGVAFRADDFFGVYINCRVSNFDLDVRVGF